MKLKQPIDYSVLHAFPTKQEKTAASIDDLRFLEDLGVKESGMKKLSQAIKKAGMVSPAAVEDAATLGIRLMKRNHSTPEQPERLEKKATSPDYYRRAVIKAIEQHGGDAGLVENKLRTRYSAPTIAQHTKAMLADDMVSRANIERRLSAQEHPLHAFAQARQTGADPVEVLRGMEPAYLNKYHDPHYYQPHKKPAAPPPKSVDEELHGATAGAEVHGASAEEELRRAAGEAPAAKPIYKNPLAIGGAATGLAGLGGLGYYAANKEDSND